MIDIEKFIGDMYKMASVRANHELCHALRYAFEKQGLEYKDSKVVPIDNKPKFKVGDWIIFNGITLYIKEVVNGYYRTISKSGLVSNYDWDIDNIARLWTIQDAKNGDVLSDGNLPFIFKKIDTNKYSYAYCGISVDDGFRIESEGKLGEWTWMQDIKPATKEQRDTLMKAMTDAGYTLDFDKKELKEIVVPIFNIGDTIIKKHNSDINDFGQFTITDITGGKYWYNDRIICDIIEQDEWELYEPVRQNPAEWSEEDENIRQWIISDIEKLLSLKKKSFIIADKEIDWLKSLKERI